jgi:L-cystine transport system substrate-binding protein
MKRIVLVLTVVLALLTLAGCGSSQAKSGSSAEKVLVGTEGTYKPFNFKDEDGNLTGYDIDVLKEVDRRIDELEFDFMAVQWDSLFLGLETGKYDMVADQLVKTPEREEKYQFTETSYFSALTYLIVQEGNNEITCLDDLKGKKAGVSVGTLYANILEEYNKKNNDAINIIYYEGNITSIFQDLEAGRLDAAMNDKLILNDAVETLGLKIKTTGEPLDVSLCYFLFPRGEKGDALRAKVDGALKEMKEDGTLTKISMQWFGEDFS